MRAQERQKLRPFAFRCAAQNRPQLLGRLALLDNDLKRHARFWGRKLTNHLGSSCSHRGFFVLQHLQQLDRDAGVIDLLEGTHELDAFHRLLGLLEVTLKILHRRIRLGGSRSGKNRERSKNGERNPAHQSLG